LIAAGLSGSGLQRLYTREPGLNLTRVKAVLLYAAANGLQAGYIYNALEGDHPIEERFLQFAALDEATLSRFREAVAELQQGGSLWPAIQTSIPAEATPLFVDFALAFTSLDEATILAALSASRVELAAPLFEPEKPDELEALWSQLLEQVQLQMPRSTFDSWLKDSHLVAWEGEQFTVVVKNQQAKEWLEKRLAATIRRTLARLVEERQGQPLAHLELHFTAGDEKLK
jgi:hypothetical protein